MVVERLPDGIAIGAQAVRHLHQNAVHLAHLLFGQPHQFVVEVDGFQRLDEQSVAAGARAVNDAIQLAALPGDDGNDEALVADGDEFLLQHAIFAVGASGSVPANSGWISSGARCRGAGGRGRRWRYRRRCHRGGFCHRARAAARGIRRSSAARRARMGKRSAAAARIALRVGRDIEQAEQVEDFLGLQSRAFDVQFVDGGFHVRNAAEFDADGGAARRGLRPRRHLEVLDSLAGLGEIGFEARAIGVRTDLLQFALAGRAGDVAAEQLPQGFEFEDFGAGFHGAAYISTYIFDVCGRLFQSRRACPR